MFIVAKTNKGTEYLYDVLSSHKVSKAAKNIICNSLNDNKYNIKNNEIWHIYEIDKYDNAYDVASYQEMKLYKNRIRIYSY